MRYLVDANLLYLPTVLIGAGLITDVVTIGGSEPAEADQTRISLTRYEVASAAGDVDTAIGKAIDETGNRRTPTALLGPYDQFKAAVNALAPAIDLMALPPLPGNVLAASVGVRVATTALSEAIWTELTALLRERDDRLGDRQLWIYGAAAFGVLVVLTAATVLWRRRRPQVVAPTQLELPQAPRPLMGSGVR